MKKILYILLLAVALPALSYAQTPYAGSVKVDFPTQSVEGKDVTFTADINFAALNLKSNQMIELTPILRSTLTTKEVRFAPIVVSGKQRARVIARAERFGDYSWNTQPSEVIVLKNKGAKSHNFSATLPFEKWMRYSELVLEETCTACCNLNQEYTPGVTSKTYAGNPFIFPTPFKPTFAVAFMTPEVEPVKVASDTFSAQLGFQVNRSNLLPQFGNNAAILVEADKKINEIKNDPMFTLKEVAVKGYASPEGNTNSNFVLSRDRAQAFINYLSNKHGLRTAGLNVKSEGMGEDWAGLRKVVAESSLDEKQVILDAIDNNPEVNKRKTAIRKLNGGRTYKMLLADFYPSLRRNEYTISYEVRSFNAEEAKELVWTRPNLLSMNEIFMASKLYDPSSREYKEIFDIAARLYPKSQVAQFNTGAMEVEIGSYDRAIERLSKIDKPESWNNLGVAYWHKGDFDKANEYFQKAANAGLEQAVKNLDQYKRWFDDKDE